MKYITEITQIIIAITALLVAVRQLYKKIFEIKKDIILSKNIDKSTGTEETLEDRGSSPIHSQLSYPEQKSFVELALVLLLASAFSVILVHTFLVAGKNPDPVSSSFLLETLGITFFITALILGGWWLNCSERIIGILAASIAIILLLAPGVSFLQYKNGEPGMPPTWPIILLLMATGATFINKTIAKSNGRPVSGFRRANNWILTTLAVVCAIGLGVRWNSDSERIEDQFNERIIPQLDALRNDKFGKQLLDSLPKMSQDARTNLYQFGSELANVDALRDMWREIASKLKLKNESNIAFIEEDRIEDTKSNESQDTDEKVKGEEDTLILPSQQQQNKARGHILEHIKRSFPPNEKLESQLEYLTERIKWIYPVPSEGPKANIGGFPGTTSADRREFFESRRLNAAWAFNVEERNYYITAFPETRERDKIREKDTKPKNLLMRFIVPGSPRSLAFPSKTPSRALQPQLLLPDNYEGFLAFEEYLMTAARCESNQKIGELIQDFSWPTGTQRLSFAQRSAFLWYVMAYMDPEIDDIDTSNWHQKEARRLESADVILNALVLLNGVLSELDKPCQELVEEDQKGANNDDNNSTKQLKRRRQISVSEENNSSDKEKELNSGVERKEKAVDNDENVSPSDLNLKETNPNARRTIEHDKEEDQVASKGQKSIIPENDGKQKTYLELLIDAAGSNDSTYALADEIVSSSKTAKVDPLAVKLIELLKTPDNLGAVARLLRSRSSEVALGPLFEREVLQYSDKLKTELDKASRYKIFSILTSPVNSVVTRLASNPNLGIVEEYHNFQELEPNKRQELLKVLAMSLYEKRGDKAPGAWNFILYSARMHSPLFANVLSTIGAFPVVLAALFFGSLMARKLQERSRLQEVIKSDQQNEHGGEYHLAGDSPLIGRESVFKRIEAYAKRGWGTVALVGRRGVGKSRVLFELYRRTLGLFPCGILPKKNVEVGIESKNEDVQRANGVSCWIVSPARYSEVEFIESVLEQLAKSTEQAIARLLNAEPLSVRVIKRRLSRDGTVLFCVGVYLLGSTFMAVSNSLDRPEIITSWLPIGILMIIAVASLLGHWYWRLQPVDLTPWLQKDRSFSAHAVLLYRRVRDSLAFLQVRQAPNNGQQEYNSKSVRRIASAFFGYIFLFYGIVEIFIIGVTGKTKDLLGDSEASTSPQEMYITSVALLTFGTLLLSYSRGSARRNVNEATNSVMSLIREYRDLATQIVYRIDKGALSVPVSHRVDIGDSKDIKGGRIAICIDELDKIVNINDVRDFLRRMKAIFEIPGVYYYMSLAEEAVGELYLGSAKGKNEFDSSIDHIVPVKALSFSEQCVVVETLFTLRGIPTLNESRNHNVESKTRLRDVVAVLSFGNPRDAARLSDDCLAELSDEKSLAFSYRVNQVNAGVELFQWDVETSRGLTSARVTEALSFALNLLFEKDREHEEERVLAMIIIIACVEKAADEILDQRVWNEFADAAQSCGSDIPSNPIGDVKVSLREICKKYHNVEFVAN